MVGPERFDMYLVCLDPTTGSEIKKMRPSVVVSTELMNRHLKTVVVAPMTTTDFDLPDRISLTFRVKRGRVALDQIRTVDKDRLQRRIGSLTETTSRAVCRTLVEMFTY